MDNVTGRCAKKCIWLAPLLVVVLLLGGCSEDGENVRATPAPQAASTSASPAEIAVGTGGSRMEMREVALYFRMQGENMLAREVRKIYLSRDDQLEKAIVRAIIDGPSASLLDLSSVFNPGTQVLSTFATVPVASVYLPSVAGEPAALEKHSVRNASSILLSSLPSAHAHAYS